MNILVFNWQDRSNPFAGGAETHLHEIFSRIVSAGHHVTLFCSMFKGAQHEEVLDGIHVIREGSRNTFNFCVPRRYRRDFCYRNFDVVVDDINKIPFYTPLYVREPILALVHHFFGTSIFAEAGCVAGGYVYAAEALLPYVYRRIRFVAVSQSTKDELVCKGIPSEHIDVVPNCINPAQFPFAIQQNPAATLTPIITYFGRLKRYKSVHHLLQAFALIADEFPHSKLRIVGKGDAEAELRRLANRLGLTTDRYAGRIEFMGLIPEEQKVTVLSEAYCVVHPSMKEGWGIVNIEANACGVPVIAADVPGLRDAVRHEYSGLLYEYGNIHALADTIRRILKDRQLYSQLQRGALAFARQFTWDISAHRILQILEECCAYNFSQ
ncbi:MAG: glycosyltransferase family 4 protein [Bacteroidota bacterium]|nr:glycosyltransferase family 4 protein [Candidatus Kapabacteria bacterium]MDW8220731.1 glycosyltransferase family 4 protein [Bacteroidota bacterium]